jgi:gamma-glutamylcyclotransferase (GGCT)/AIG2-like uncharacterized protein YtfP
MSQRHELFVYGTLMQGEHHHETLAGAEFLGLVEITCASGSSSRTGAAHSPT